MNGPEALAALLDLGPDRWEDWRDQALCAQVDTEIFFPEKGGGIRDAKKICAACEVRAECLADALARGERFGIWGGLSERERRRLQPISPVRPEPREPRERRPVEIDHGTEVGYRAHLRLGEDPCPACTAAPDQPAPEPETTAEVLRERPGITRPWRPAELAEAVRLLADYGMTAQEIAAELHVPAKRVRGLFPARRGAA